MKTMAWIERKFDFGAPASLFPQLLERLRGTPARLEERMRNLAPEVLRRREGTAWSIQENVGHLLDVERLWQGRLDDYDAGLARIIHEQPARRQVCRAGRALRHAWGAVISDQARSACTKCPSGVFDSARVPS